MEMTRRKYLRILSWRLKENPEKAYLRNLLLSQRRVILCLPVKEKRNPLPDLTKHRP
jgi:hypothetical protein